MLNAHYYVRMSQMANVHLHLKLHLKVLNFLTETLCTHQQVRFY